MNPLSRLPVLLFVLFIFCVLSCQPAELETAPKSIKKEGKKEANTLYPQDLFFLDRNYPDYDAPDGLYQAKLRKAIQYDKTTPRKNRGNDFPWTLQGPGNIGGRINTIAVNPGDKDHILFGFSQGGIYLTTDGGNEWKPVFDDQPSLSISHISFDPVDHNLVYAATGDVNISGYPHIGSGVYRSNDGGETWESIGLQQTGVLSKVLADPHNPDILYAGCMGFPSHKSNHRGLYRSVNGGDSWNQELFIDDSTGIIDIVVDPTTPGRLFASGWTRLRTNTYGATLCEGSSLYRSDDYGATWMNILNGLPTQQHSRTGIEITNNGTLFISYIGPIHDGECADFTESLQSVHKSIDGGESWQQINTDPTFSIPCELLGGFGWYFETLKVNPNDPNDIFLLGVDMYRTLDGGNSWFEAVPSWWTYEVHADKHDLVFAGDEMFLATDGGAYRQEIQGGFEWFDMENIPATQFYRTAYNPHEPDMYFGGAQDNGTTGGNSNAINDWWRIFGGDGFQPLFDPEEPEWMYVTTQYGYVWLKTDTTDFEHLSEGLFGPAYWDMPLIMDADNSKVIYCATDRVFRMNVHDSLVWVPISPILTKGGTILGNRKPSITALAQSPADPLRLYAGTLDGKVWTTPDGGETWKDMSEGTPGFFVTSITTGLHPLVVYVTYSGYREGDHTPYIIHTFNEGEYWTAIETDLPMLGVNNLLILSGFNTEVKVAATDGGVYFTVGGGNTWERLGTNMPYMPVYDIDYNPVERTIIAATFSRGIMTFPIDEIDIVSSVDKPGIARNKMSLYPTLVSDQFHIEMEGGLVSANNLNIQIVDLSGRPVSEFKYEMQSGNRIKIEFAQPVVPQLYYVQVSDGKEVYEVGKFVKM